jgi:hypothetical protein
LAFVLMLKARFKEFQGKPSANCWWTGFSETGEYDPDKGYVYVLTDDSGSLAVKIWVHADDFLIHGDTYKKTARALKLFLDTTVDVGMLCHPKKLTPPAQVVKYCGFLMDSRGIPCLCIPDGKQERALAIVEHLIEAHEDRAFSRLSLAVAAGVLQSLVEATPLRLGHTYLRRFHGVVRPEGLGTGAAPYYTTTTLPLESKRESEVVARVPPDAKGPLCAVPSLGHSGAQLGRREWHGHGWNPGPSGQASQDVEGKVGPGCVQVLVQLEGVEHVAAHSGQPPAGGSGGRARHDGVLFYRQCHHLLGDGVIGLVPVPEASCSH